MAPYVASCRHIAPHRVIELRPRRRTQSVFMSRIFSNRLAAPLACAPLSHAALYPLSPVCASVLATLWQAGVNYIQGYYLQGPTQAMDYDFAEDE